MEYRRNCWLWNIDTVTIWKTLDKKSGEISEDEIINIHDEDDYNEKRGSYPIKVVQKKLHIKEHLRSISWHWKRKRY